MVAGLNGEKLPISLKLGDRMIDGAIVKPLTYATFVECIAEANGMTSPKTFEGKIKRARMVKQITFYTNGATTPVTAAEIVRLSIHDARKLNALIDADEDKPGKITRPGDGIDKAIVFELGTPIPVQGKPPITELEFMAKTYGEIEDVLAATDTIAQSNLLIQTIAKPLGTSLTVLPSWALAQITVADGIAIAREVLPHFTESPAESPSE